VISLKACGEYWTGIIHYKVGRFHLSRHGPNYRLNCVPENLLQQPSYELQIMNTSQF
jgi:hypothetical protein